MVQWLRASQVVLEVKNPPVSSRDSGSIPGSGRSPGGGHGNPLQHSCLKNPTDRAAMVHSITKSRTQLKQLSMHTTPVGENPPLSAGDVDSVPG